MQSMDQFMGTGVALATPFTAEGSIDQNGLRKLVDHVIEGGVDYLVVLGTTGESVTLNQDEKQLVRQTVIDQSNNRVPLVIGIGGNDTAQICQDLSTMDLTAFQAILSVSPAYNKPTQQGIYAHFEQIAHHSPLPIILYNVPARTGSNMLPETVIKLAIAHNNIIGIKEAAGDIVQAMDLIKMAPEGFLVISGEDMITLPMTLSGGSGVISVIGQGLPAEFSDMVKAALSGKNELAQSLHYRIMPAIKLIFEQGNPAGIKSMLAHLGICTGDVRLPLVKADDDLHERIGAFLREF